jgi:hypothetical protein
VDEHAWIACDDPDKMLRFLQYSGKLRERKSKLFAVACCRRIWHLLVDERLQETVAVTEAHADGNMSAEVMSAAYDVGLMGYRAAYEHMMGHPPPEVISMTVTDPSGQTGVIAWLDSHPQGEAAADAPLPRAAALSAAEAVLRAASPARLLPWTAYELAAEAAAGVSRWARPCPVDPMAQRAEHAVQAVLVRDLFGPLPFRPLPPLEPPIGTWNNGFIVKLATAIYEERSLPSGQLDPQRLAVLSDALEEAGVTDPDILGHLRQQGAVHVRGCFVVDLLLGKS